ncbi:MAG: lectin-like protein [Prochloraceae cyanobacterium]
MNFPTYYSFNNSLYTVVPAGGNWNTAENNAIALGGNLVSISDAAENSFVQSIITSQNLGRVWIGASDQLTEWNYTWSDGTAFTYTNWAPGEPNNDGGNEDFAEMFSNGQWNDNSIGNPFAPTTGIAEINLGLNPANPAIFNGSLYVVVPSGGSWTTAESNANALGGNLVSISDAAENSFVQSIMTSQNLNRAWIGASDQLVEGVFAWSDGSPFTYENWALGEPNNAGGNEDFVEMYSNGQWNDAIDSAAGVDFGIAEISLASLLVV